MSALSSTLRLARMVLAVLSLCGAGTVHAQEKDDVLPCTEDAMLVFDASGSMSGTVGLGIATFITRIDLVRSALQRILPTVTQFRRVGLITYGPGPYDQCNVRLDLEPAPNSASRIMRDVTALTPAGKTPLTSAVVQAAEVLDYRNKPGLVVVLTDGEETCGGSPCDMGKSLHATADQLTVHVISYRPKDFTWTGEHSILDIKCLARENGGLYITAQTEEELTEALEKTLGCPMVTRRQSPTPWSGNSKWARLHDGGHAESASP